MECQESAEKTVSSSPVTEAGRFRKAGPSIP